MEIQAMTEKLARLAGKQAVAKQTELQTWSKNDDPRDLVTSADIEIAELLKAQIHEAFPHDYFYSEESRENIEPSGRLWVIDPIDGTSNYARGIPLYSCCVSVLEAGDVIAGTVFAPALNECFTLSPDEARLNGEPITVAHNTHLAEAYVNFHPGRKPEHRQWAGDLKRFFLEHTKKSLNLGSSALDLAYLACGRFDMVVYGTLTTLDVAGAITLVRAAGGEVYNLSNSEPVAFSNEPQPIIATANQALVEAFLAKTTDLSFS